MPRDPQGAGTRTIDDFGRCLWCGQMASTGGCVNYRCPSKAERIETTTTITREEL